MSEQNNFPPCRSVNQEGTKCVRKHAHKALEHSDGKGGYWIGGSKKPAGKTFPKEPKREPVLYQDNGHLSEADYATWAGRGSFL